MRNDLLFVLSFFVVVLVYVTSSSSASVMISVVTLLLGVLVALLLGKTSKERTDMTTVMLVSFVVVTLAVILKYLDFIADYSSFAREGNDNYFFYYTSWEGKHATSIGQIFNECVIQNIHYENGGYFFFIESLAYLATKYADGNHLLLQLLGTAMPSIMNSVVIYAILSGYCPRRKTKGYTLFFIVLSPLIMHSVAIHRDVMIALFYFILIYLWLCKDFSLKVGILQVFLSVVLYYLREQHGLFALSFLVLSAISAHKQNRFMYIVAIASLIAIVGVTYISDMLSTSMVETNQFYYNLRSDRLSGLDSGIGRFVYMLPFPLRELAQIFFLQLRFPPWMNLSEAGNFPAIILGLLSFAVAFYWFYVFSCVFVCVIKKGIKCLPIKLIYGLLLLLVFLFLSTSNLDSRRVVCMYPLMYVAFVYYRETVLNRGNILSFSRNYIIVYSGICLLYFAMKFIAG